MVDVLDHALLRLHLHTSLGWQIMAAAAAAAASQSVVVVGNKLSGQFLVMR